MYSLFKKFEHINNRLEEYTSKKLRNIINKDTQKQMNVLEEEDAYYQNKISELESKIKILENGGEAAEDKEDIASFFKMATGQLADELMKVKTEINNTEKEFAIFQEQAHNKRKRIRQNDDLLCRQSQTCIHTLRNCIESKIPIEKTLENLQNLKDEFFVKPSCNPLIPTHQDSRKKLTKNNQSLNNDEQLCKLILDSKVLPTNINTLDNSEK